MWLITTFGFFSVVRKPGDDNLIVRARTRYDLQELRERFLPELGETTENAVADYKYSASVRRDAAARAIGEIVMNIDYASLRDRVLSLQGFCRALVYGRISNILWGLQEDEQWFDPNNR